MAASLDGSAIRRSQYRDGAGGRHKAALARLHSARSLNRSQGFTAGCRGSSLAPTGRRSFTARIGEFNFDAVFLELLEKHKDAIAEIVIAHIVNHTELGNQLLLEIRKGR